MIIPSGCDGMCHLMSMSAECQHPVTNEHAFCISITYDVAGGVFCICLESKVISCYVGTRGSPIRS